MSSFNNLLSRAYLLSEAKVSPYATAHPSFGAITSKMRAGGLSSAPLDTIKFIREILYYLDIIGDEELNAIKRAAGFTGKKQAMLSVLKSKQQEINAKTQEIADRVTSTLDDFINGVGTNRGREEKYAAQAAAQEMANQMRQAKSGKQMDDALTDIVADESLIVRTAVAKILADIQKNLGEPGFDIEEEALSEVIDFSGKINSLATLKSFIQQIANEPGYEKIAAYLSSAVRPISQGTEDEEMQEDAEDDVEAYYDPSGAGVSPEEYDEVMGSDLEDIYKKIDHIVYDTNFYTIVDDEGARPNSPELEQEYKNLVKQAIELTGGEGPAHRVDPMLHGEYSDFTKSKHGRRDRSPISYNEMMRWFKSNNINVEDEEYEASKADINDDGEVEGWEKGLAKKKGFENVPVTENYTACYLTEQTKKDSVYNPSKIKTQTFKERYKPKTSWQLEELRRYGM
jgi:hypothetical protein